MSRDHATALQPGRQYETLSKKKKYDDNFETKDFPEKAKDVFSEPYLCLNNSHMTAFIPW